MGKGGSVLSEESTAMSEDTPVNIGVVHWPARIRRGGRYGRCSSSCIVGRAKILLAGLMICATWFTISSRA